MARRTVSYEDEQLRLARIVQSALLPPTLADLQELDVAARFLPSANVGGDFFDYFTLGPQQLAFYLGDVQGKGLEGALYALLISGLMRGLHKTGTEPAEVVASLNRRLCFRSPPGKFCCLNYALFDLKKRRLKYASAGLPFPLLLRRKTLTRIELTGAPVGMFTPYQFDQVVLDLEPGDRLLFYTDGLPDAFRALPAQQSDGGNELEELFAADVRESADAQADRLVRHLQALHSRHANFLFDDATVLVFHVL